jgi:hypothetical protein
MIRSLCLQSRFGYPNLWLPSPPALRGRRAGDEGARARERTTLIAMQTHSFKTPLPRPLSPKRGEGSQVRRVGHFLAHSHFPFAT